jgi:GAF domain-containing protein
MDYTLRSVMVIPMILRDEVIGALYADNRMKDGQFRKELLPLMTAFASQAAIAIENARLFSQIRADLDAAKSEVRSLRIQIDSDHAEKEISDIIEGDFFKRLQDLARSEDASESEDSATP